MLWVVKRMQRRFVIAVGEVERSCSSLRSVFQVVLATTNGRDVLVNTGEQ